MFCASAVLSPCSTGRAEHVPGKLHLQVRIGERCKEGLAQDKTCLHEVAGASSLACSFTRSKLWATGITVVEAAVAAHPCECLSGLRNLRRAGFGFWLHHPTSKFLTAFGATGAPGVVVPTCRALPLVSMGSVTAEMAQMMHTEEKRHRAPKKEALIRTCRSKNIKQQLIGVGGWHLISN